MSFCYFFPFSFGNQQILRCSKTLPFCLPSKDLKDAHNVSYSSYVLLAQQSLPSIWILIANWTISTSFAQPDKSIRVFKRHLKLSMHTPALIISPTVSICSVYIAVGLNSVTYIHQVFLFIPFMFTSSKYAKPVIAKSDDNIGLICDFSSSPLSLP